MSAPDKLESWAEIRDDTDAIIACGERWKEVARTIGCELHGFNDGRSASFFTPDGNVIEVGPKFRTAIAALGAHLASGTLTEGGDVEQAPGDSLGGPTAESRDAQ